MSPFQRYDQGRQGEIIKGAEEVGFKKENYFDISIKQTTEILIDSSAGRIFIDQNFAKNFEINYLDELVKAYNVN
jgi:hypothetical protein